MVNCELNSSKINDYLSSFFAAKNISQNKNFTHKGIDEDFGDSLSRRQCDLSNEKKRTLPNDEKEYKLRVSSFKFGLWTTLSLSPLLCSKLGWYLTEKDILKCVTCKAILCSSLPPQSKKEAYHKFLNILRGRLVTSHKDWCGWKENRCPPEFLHPPFTMTSSYFKNLVRDANEVAKLELALPYIKAEVFLNKMGLKVNHLSQFFGNRESLTKYQITAAVLVLCGWICESPHKIKCNICLRSVGLWNFLPITQEEEFLELSLRDDKRQEERRIKEMKKQVKEKKRERKSYLRENKLKEEMEVKADEIKAKEDALKVKEAIEKLEQFDSGSSSSLPDDNEEDFCDDEQEKSLLAEEEVISFDKTETSSPANDEINVQNNTTGGSNTANCAGDQGESKLGQIDSNDEERNSRLKISNEDFSSSDSDEKQTQDDDDLWLDAVNVKKGEHSSPSTDDEVYEEDGFCLSFESIEKESNNKRRRISSGSSADESENINPQKVLKFEEEIESSVSENLMERNGPVKMQEEEKEISNDSGEDNCKSEDEIDNEPDEQDDIFNKMKSSLLNPLEQHRYWCGWVFDYGALYLDPELFGSNTEPGYKILPQQLKEFMPEFTSESLAKSEKYENTVENLRAVRTILDSWFLPPREDTEEMKSYFTSG